MNILITGVTGLFGRELAKTFSSLGTIHGLRRSNSSFTDPDLAGVTIQWHEGDILDFSSLLEAVAGMDIVIHAAGKVSFLPQDDKEVYKVNHEGTTYVVNALLATGVPKLVYVSSVAALGQIPDQEDYDEKSTWVDAADQTSYAISKYMAELECWRGEQEGLQVLVVNPAVLLGKISYTRSSGVLYQAIRKGLPFFPAGNLNYIDVRDAAAITQALVAAQAWGERFILTKESIPYQAFFQKATQVIGGIAPTRVVPNWGINWGFPLLKMVSLLFGKKLPLSAAMARNAQQKTRYRNQKVEAYLQFRYRDLQETLSWANTPG